MAGLYQSAAHARVPPAQGERSQGQTLGEPRAGGVSRRDAEGRVVRGRSRRSGRDEAYEKARAIFDKLRGKDNGPGAALTASGFPGPPKSFWQRVADALDDPWWEDEFEKGDPLAPALVTARHAARAAGETPARIAEHREQTALVGCLFGNPFRPRPVCGAWLTREVRALADTLEASVCTNADLIQHCRSGEEHARGCWVVDLLLGKG